MLFSKDPNQTNTNSKNILNFMNQKSTINFDYNTFHFTNIPKQLKISERKIILSFSLSTKPIKKTNHPFIESSMCPLCFIMLCILNSSGFDKQTLHILHLKESAIGL
jgi:hypothetical protein